jgi:hypothetical protein
MYRITAALSWTLFAAASMVAFWYVLIYIFDEFNHGYGQRNWFDLNVYLSLLSVVIGLVGYGLAIVYRPRHRRVLAACLAGIVFAACELALVFAMGWGLPDRDTTLEGLAGALVIGALSALVAPGKAIRS